MATLTASAAASGVQPIANNGLNVVNASYTLGASSSAGDVIRMVKVPAGARICYGKVAITGAGLTGFSVGDGLDPDRYVLSATNSSVVVSFNATTMDYSYSAADTIDITIDTTPTATAAGTFYLTAFYTFLQD